MSRLIRLLQKSYRGNLYRFSARLIFLTEAAAAILSIFIAIDSVLYYGGASIVLTPRMIFFGVLIFLSWLALSRVSTLSVLPLLNIKNRTSRINFNKNRNY